MSHGVTKRKAVSRATSVDVAEYGGWVDKGVPDLAKILAAHPEVDGAALTSWLGGRLGRFRAYVEADRSAPTFEAARVELDKMCARAVALQEMLAAEVAHPLVEMQLHDGARAHGSTWEALRDQAAEAVSRLLRVADGASLDLAGYQVKRGRRPATARDSLVADLVLYLRQVQSHGRAMKASQARMLAAEILKYCGVDMTPIKSNADDDAQRTVRRAVRRGQ